MHSKDTANIEDVILLNINTMQVNMQLKTSTKMTIDDKFFCQSNSVPITKNLHKKSIVNVSEKAMVTPLQNTFYGNRHKFSRTTF